MQNLLSDELWAPVLYFGSLSEGVEASIELNS